MIILPQLIEDGTEQFLMGGYGAFDHLAATAVHLLKADYPQIRSTMVLPYLNREYKTELYDDTVYPPLEKVPPRLAIVRRNRWMVDQADVIISYVTHSWGGAADMLRYAVKSNKRVIYINLK